MKRKKDIYNYENKRVINYSGTVLMPKKDRIILETFFTLEFVALGVAIVLGLLHVVTLEEAVAIFAIGMGVFVLLPMIFFVFKYFVFGKVPMEKEDYHIKKTYNGITGKSDVEITDYTDNDED